MEFEILKNLDIKSLPQACLVNKIMNKLCNDKHFWFEKFKHDYLQLFIEPSGYSEWIKEYNKIHNLKDIAKKVLMINDIERNRSDQWQSEGSICIYDNDTVNISDFFNDKKLEINDITVNLMSYWENYYIYPKNNHYILSCIIDHQVNNEDVQHDIQVIKSKNEIIDILTSLIYHKCRIEDSGFDGIPFLIADQEPPTNYSENERLWFNRRVGLWEALNYLIN
jgi:hypothetical protein